MQRVENIEVIERHNLEAIEPKTKIVQKPNKPKQVPNNKPFDENYDAIKKLTSNTAITLVALVIIIIVLLILSAVTLNMIIGPNGIIKKAQKAREETEYKTAQEELELILTEAKTTIIAENRELSIPEIAEEIQNAKDKKIEMLIRYMPKAEVEIYKEEVTGQNGVIRTNRPCRNRIQRLQIYTK